jgi:hypothetical protein
VLPGEQLMPRARELANQIALCSPEAVRHIKVLTAGRGDRDRRLEAELEQFALHVRGADLTKGLTAFRRAFFWLQVRRRSPSQKCRRNADILSTSCSGTLSTRPISCRWSKLLGARRRPKTLLIARADFIARWANACSPHQGNLWAYR